MLRPAALCLSALSLCLSSTACLAAPLPLPPHCLLTTACTKLPRNVRVGPVHSRPVPCEWRLPGSGSDLRGRSRLLPKGPNTMSRSGSSPSRNPAKQRSRYCQQHILAELRHPQMTSNRSPGRQITDNKLIDQRCPLLASSGDSPRLAHLA